MNSKHWQEVHRVKQQSPTKLIITKSATSKQDSDEQEVTLDISLNTLATMLFTYWMCRQWNWSDGGIILAMAIWSGLDMLLNINSQIHKQINK
jgi:hypothetical protein